MNTDNDKKMNYYDFMPAALKEAEKGAAAGDIPVGAVAVYDNKIIAAAHNTKEAEGDPTAHAEILCLRQAAEYLGSWHLEGVTLFVTMEPCPMCAGAILQARIKTLVFGCFDAKWGCCGSKLNALEPGLFNHNTEVISGIMEEECKALVRDFFRDKRNLEHRNELTDDLREDEIIDRVAKKILKEHIDAFKELAK